MSAARSTVRQSIASRTDHSRRKLLITRERRMVRRLCTGIMDRKRQSMYFTSANTWLTDAGTKKESSTYRRLTGMTVRASRRRSLGIGRDRSEAKEHIRTTRSTACGFSIMRTGMKLIVKIIRTAKELTNRVHAPRHTSKRGKEST